MPRGRCSSAFSSTRRSTPTGSRRSWGSSSRSAWRTTSPSTSRTSAARRLPGGALGLPALLALLIAPGCSGGDSSSTPDAGPDATALWPTAGWPARGEWSWDGAWTPAASDFPLPGLFDDEYFDGHVGPGGSPTPVLPPGEWDWDDANDDLANWRNFETNLGRFEPELDGGGRQYGWRFVPNSPGRVDYAGPASYFEGSSGADILDLGAGSTLHSFGAGNLGDGPDVLVFESSYSLDFRTGSTATGASRDNDLVVAGCGANPGGVFDIETTTIHTGPGNDWVFIRDLSRAAVDLGNGADGRTDTLDPGDGDDLIVLRGNTHDFRVFGGGGDDLVFWYIDDNVQTTTWLGPNFFGGGGADAALWNDPGVDRLVLAIPDDTPIVTATPTPPGSLLVRGTDGTLILDDPTQSDPFARYCVECGTGPGGERTVILEYVSADESVRTGYFYVTAFEELQVGVGAGARLFAIDSAVGTVSPVASPVLATPPEWPDYFCPGE